MPALRSALRVITESGQYKVQPIMTLRSAKEPPLFHPPQFTRRRRGGLTFTSPTSTNPFFFLEFFPVLAQAGTPEYRYLRPKKFINFSKNCITLLSQKRLLIEHCICTSPVPLPLLLYGWRGHFFRRLAQKCHCEAFTRRRRGRPWQSRLVHRFIRWVNIPLGFIPHHYRAAGRKSAVLFFNPQ